MSRSTKGRSDSLTIRIQPKLRYGLVLLARKQRRNLSGVVEWALHCSIHGDDGLDLEKLWACDDKTRIKNLEKHAPNLLTFEEQVYLEELNNDR